jgi:hypothetical protein
VRLESETARIVKESGAGWVTNAETPSEFASVAAAKLKEPDALRAAGRAGFAYAAENFRPGAVAAKFDALLTDVVDAEGRRAHSGQAR